MSTRDLRARYGGTGNSRALVNKAIRAELVGGDHCLDALNALDQLRQQWLARGWTEGLDEINAALGHVHRLYARLRAEIRDRYGLPRED